MIALAVITVTKTIYEGSRVVITITKLFASQVRFVITMYLRCCSAIIVDRRLVFFPDQTKQLLDFMEHLKPKDWALLCCSK